MLFEISMAITMIAKMSFTMAATMVICMSVAMPVFEAAAACGL